MLPEALQAQVLGNRIADYLLVLAVAVVGLLALNWLVRGPVLGGLSRWAARAGLPFEQALRRPLRRALLPLGYVGVLYLAVRSLALHPALARAIDVIALVAVTFWGIDAIVSLLDGLLRAYWATGETDAGRQQLLDTAVPVLRGLLWVVGAIFLLANLGLNVSALVAGLGVGGLAIALAAQGVLQDLFAYVSILLDRPFQLGDFIIVGEAIGTVERIGIKTTRLRSLGGEELVMANTDLLSSRIQNYRRMEERCIAFSIGVTYETPLERLREIPELMQQILAQTDNVRFERCHFKAYGDFSLTFETVYYLTSSDYGAYMDAQQQINLALKQAFDARGIEFAYPTQVLYLNGSAPQPIASSAQ